MDWICVPARAEGYRNPPEGAAAIGAIGGYSVFADDANATIHNSANLVDLSGPMFQINLLTGYGRNQFKTLGVSDRSREPFFAIPGFSLALPLDSGRLAFGVALYVPYGRSVKWRDDDYFALRGLPYAGSMTVADLTPNVAFRLGDSLSLGLGADLYYGRVKQDTRLFGLEALGIPAGTYSRLDADGEALGWNGAIIWKMAENQRLVATFRAPFSIPYEGDNTLSIGNKSDVEAEIDYPTIVGLAYGVEWKQTWRLELSGEWLEFSRYRELTVKDDAFGTRTYPQKLNDTWTAGLGLYWNFKPGWTLRGGYKYLENPTPDDTYGPLTPDEDQGVVSLGLGYEDERHCVDLGLAHGLFNGRNIPESNPAGGKYDFDVQLLSFSYGFKF